MKKLAILSFHWLSKKGGPSTFVFFLTKALRKNTNFEVFIITPDPYKRSDTINVKGKKLLLLFTTFKALLKTKPDVIHVQGNPYMLFSSIIYKILFPSTRVVFTFHTQPVNKTYSMGILNLYIKAKNFLKSKVFNWFLNKCDEVTAVSNDLKNNIELQGLFFKKGIKIIPPGVEIRNFDYNKIERFKLTYKLNDAYPIICTIGVFTWFLKVKGIEILIESFKELVQSYPKAKLIIVGDGRYRQYLKNIVKKLSLEDYIIFTGFMDNPFIPLQISDIYCHLSLMEGLPIAILEAMIMGKPIVAANCGGIPEVITNNKTGLLVKPEVSEVTKAIQILLQNKEFSKKLGRNARKVAQEKYNWERIAAEFIKLYIE